MPRALFLLGLCSILLGAPAHADAIRDFQRAWGAAGDDPSAQRAALDALAREDSAEVARVLAQVALSPELSPQVKNAAGAHLFSRTDPSVTLWASEGLSGRGPDALKVLQAQYLAHRATDDPDAGILLIPALEEDPPIAAAAVAGLAKVRRASVVAALIAALPDLEGRPRADAIRALADLTHESHTDPEAWAGWWAAVGASYSLPAPGRSPAAQPTGRTVTRLDAPGGVGRTIYGDVRSSHVVFVVDVSYSMHVRAIEDTASPLSRLQYVQAELSGVIEEQLDDDDEFTIVTFSTEARALGGELVRANRRNKRRAVGFVGSLQPDGDTNIHDALQLAMRVPEVDTIYFLTDGTPTHGPVTVNDELLECVRAWNLGREIQIHTIAFLAGDGASFNVVEQPDMARRFLEALAEQTGGTFTLFD